MPNKPTISNPPADPKLASLAGDNAPQSSNSLGCAGAAAGEDDAETAAPAIVIVCATCKRWSPEPGVWIPAARFAGGQYQKSHGLCPDCTGTMRAQLPAFPSMTTLADLAALHRSNQTATLAAIRKIIQDQSARGWPDLDKTTTDFQELITLTSEYHLALQQLYMATVLSA